MQSVFEDAYRPLGHGLQVSPVHTWPAGQLLHTPVALSNDGLAGEHTNTLKPANAELLANVVSLEYTTSPEEYTAPPEPSRATLLAKLQFTSVKTESPPAVIDPPFTFEAEPPATGSAAPLMRAILRSVKDAWEPTEKCCDNQRASSVHSPVPDGSPWLAHRVALPEMVTLPPGCTARAVPLSCT